MPNRDGMRITILGWGPLIWGPRDLRISDAGHLPVPIKRLIVADRDIQHVTARGD